MKKYDVVIAGAGPGGSTAAYNLSKAGLDICLLDKANFPRFKACGGGLCPHISKFSYIDNEFLKISSKSSTIYGPSLKYSMNYSPKRSLFYQINRNSFDHHLCLKAQEYGTDFLQKQYVKSIEKHDSNMIVKTKNSSYSCKLVIGATGVYGPIAKYLRKVENLPIRWNPSEIAFCLLTEIPMKEHELVDRFSEDRTVILFFLDKIKGGYGWVFPKKSSVNIGMGTLLNIFKLVDPISSFKEFIKQLISLGYLSKNLPSYKIHGGILPCKGPIPKNVTNNVILIGDSAGFVSPLTGEGIFFAMDSGKIASEVIIESFEKETFHSKQLKKYSYLCRKSWGKDLYKLIKLKSLLEKNIDKGIRYSILDNKLSIMLEKLMTFEKSPSELNSPIIRRYLFDFIRFDLFNIKKKDI